MEYLVHGISKTGRYIRAEVKAESQSHAMHLVRSLHPDAAALACRPPKHAEAVLDALASRAVANRVAA
jgi:hypothetical protein